MSPLFLVGCPRSGTTWLQLILGSHPRIATYRETHLFDTYLAALYGRWWDEASAPHKDGLRLLLSEAEFDGAARHFCKLVLAKIGAAKPGADYVLEKTPGNVQHHQLIRRLCPEARFLHLVRDPRAVVASLLAARKEAWGYWAPRDAFEAARLWRDLVATGHYELARYGEDRLEVRYEDLAMTPDLVLGRIYDWLGLDRIAYDGGRFSLAEIKRHVTEGDPRNPAWEDRSNFFRQGTVDGWCTELSEQQVGIIEGVCAGLLEELGYAPRQFGVVGGGRDDKVFVRGGEPEGSSR